MANLSHLVGFALTQCYVLRGISFASLLGVENRPAHKLKGLNALKS